MAVAGFDDIPMARYLNPPLTTAHVDMLRLGQRAVALLLDGEAAPPEGRREVLSTTLVVRGSCGAPAHGTDRPRPRWDRSRIMESHRR
jgi:LacI family transcriptional regulator